MKAIFLTLVILLNAENIFCQYEYDFNYSISTYSDLNNATQATTNKWDDQTVLNVPIGFSFKFYDYTASNLSVYPAVGSLAFGNHAIEGVGFSSVMQDKSSVPSSTLSPVSYKTEGTSGNLVLKVEFKNMGFTGGIPADFLNMQIWLYQQGNKIEFRYGTSSIQNTINAIGGTGPIVNLIRVGASDFFSNQLGGQASSPQILSGINLPPAYLWGMPADGMVYTFSPLASGISDLSNELKMNLSPNPTTDKIFITAEEPIETAELYNLLGEKPLNTPETSSGQALKGTLNSKKAEIDVAELPKGVYLVRVSFDPSDLRAGKLRMTEGGGLNAVRRVVKE